MRMLLAIAVSAPFVLFAAPPAHATADGPDVFRVAGVASNDVLWIRSGPGTRYEKVGSIPFNGTNIQNLGCEGRWCQVRYRGVTGWASQRFLYE